MDIPTETPASSSSSSDGKEERYLVLIEFAYRHLDFQIAEIESVLDMHGIQLGSPDCRVYPLPGQDETGRTTPASSNPELRRPYLILSFPAKDASKLSDNSNSVDRWGLVTRATNENASIAEILSRCTLVKTIVELWGASTSSLDTCAKECGEWIKNTKVGQSIFANVAGEQESWKLTVHTLGTKYTREEQAEMRDKFSYLGFQGPVQMKEPNHEYVLIREVEMDGKGSPLHPRHGIDKNVIPEHDKLPPLGLYFGRLLGGKSKKGRGGLEQYNLKNRVYLGPTSMDAELSFVMTNYGQVQKGSVVFDPFVGTGSILLSCALRGAYCMGSDIDIRVLKGRNKEETIWKNFDQYHLRRPELLRTDNAIYHRHFRRHQPLYDAIVCDPPYGIRAGARKTGSRKDTPRPILEEHRHDHIAQTKPYPVSDVMSDLLDVAARTLVMSGRLVYVIPSFHEFDPHTDLPRHECLKLVHSCYQPLQAELGRRIVVMKKIKDYDFSKRDHYMSNIWVNGTESAEKCANLRDKILEAAKQKPDYERKAAVRRQKRKVLKEEKKAAKKKKKKRLGEDNDEVEETQS
ncbi:unnamed protein product [Cylindrotheca closterium]|uniref:tRNA (guanine(10)-N(2))-methyltransferase n=1 Tax=Cylindrotheca closterium TaxID=2856 RepID=A0AAD2PY17_9STRA|nr:unnamed protein product [Cylindrotheca closterium]